MIIGKLIPAGTGFHAYPSRQQAMPNASLETQGALDIFGHFEEEDDFEMD